MIPYWLLWSYFFVGVFMTGGRGDEQSGGAVAAGALPRMPSLLLAGLVIMTLLAGLRFEVGGDWVTYGFMFERSQGRELADVLEQGDPGYSFLNWSAHQLGFEIWFVNLAAAIATVWGIGALVKREPNPWLSVLLAIPYLFVVVAMGYTRQAAALGFVMIGVAGLMKNGSVLRYAMWIGLAALFHKSAVVCLPLIAFTGKRELLIDLFLVTSASLGLYTLFLQDSLDVLVRNYIGARYSSAGAAIRISMSVLPAIVFLLYRHRLGFSDTEKRLWRNFSLVSLIAAVALVLSPSSTAVDRIALYLLPLQFIVLARIPGNLVSRSFGNVLIAAYSGAVLFTWLTFAVHAQHWLPYQWWFAR